MWCNASPGIRVVATLSFTRRLRSIFEVMKDYGLQELITVFILALPYCGKCLLGVSEVVHMVHEGSYVDHPTVD
ncbi:hypothetical protein KEM56_001601 [Ascosphaera pollenicola]|nr:hypothetical protein KEM56_001601 [Ascosphaera pollenicola]